MRILFIVLTLLLLMQCTEADRKTSENTVTIVEKPESNHIEILFDGELFTAYIYPDNIMKPVLWPIRTAQGKTVTRSFPLDKTEGERTDHPHQVGLWFTYGDVNGLDYWNNSEAIPADKKDQYGTIFHREVLSSETAGNTGVLKVKSQWVGHDHPELDEVTEFTFTNNGNVRMIDRVSTLYALQDVSFDDNKEGVLGMRVASQLEMPSDDEITLTDAHGNPTTVKGSNKLASGNYLSSEGITGEAVWGTRGRWMDLTGDFDGDRVSVVIIDHPENPGYPTYWHARGYGLFAANPLGQAELSGGKDTLNFKMAQGEKVTFRYRIVISENPDADEDTWNQLADDFAADAFQPIDKM